MPHDRFFSPLPLKQGLTLPLPPDEARHMKVMRKRTGDTVEVIDGQGHLARATVVDSEHLLLDSVEHHPKPTPAITLAVALPHPSHLDWMVEKVTELGIDSLHFFPGILSDFKSLKTNQTDRINRLVIAATKQSGRLYLPTLELKPPLEKWEKPSVEACFGSLDSQDGYLVDAKPLIFFIGPEKGFHSKELELFKQWDIKGKRLNPNILRAETAAVTAAALLLGRCGIY